MKKLKVFESFTSNINYKTIDFNYGVKDSMFEYYYPDLKQLGVENPTDEQKAMTYIATNDKRHLHINIDSSLQNKGLASEIIKAFVYRYGYRIIPKGRIVNPDMLKVLNKIKLDPKFEVSDEGNYYEIDEL